MRLTLFLMFLSAFSALAQELSPSQPKKFPVVIDVCGCGMEVHYAGGGSALSAFINDNIQLPSDIDWGETSRVRAYVQFIVEKDGSLTDIHIARTNFSGVDDALLSVFRSMTNWVASEYDCVSARTRVRVPISLIIK